MGSEIFGKLVMPVEKTGEELISSGVPLWSDSPINRYLIIASAVIILFCIKDFFFVGGDIFKSFWRWRWSFKIESNMTMAKSRDICALGMVLPSILLISFYVIPQKAVWYASILFAAYSVSKRLIYLMLEGHRDCSEDLKTSYHSGKNHFFLLVLSLSVLAIIFEVTGTPKVISSRTLLFAYAFFFLASFVRKFQILHNSLHGFRTFLYLCALEILPLAISVWLDIYYGQ